MCYGHSPSSALAGDPRSPGFTRAAGSSRSPSDAHSPVVSEGVLVLPMSLPREVRRDLSWWMVRDHLLTGVRFGTPAPDLHLYSDASSSGHSLSRSTRVRGVVRPGEVAAHQSSRNEASFLRPSGIPRRCHRSSRDRDVRQLGGRGVRQEARGHGFLGSMLVGQLPSEMDGELRSISMRGIFQDRPMSWRIFSAVALSTWFGSHIKLLVPLLNNHWFHATLKLHTNKTNLSRRGQVIGTEWSLHP